MPHTRIMHIILAHAPMGFFHHWSEKEIMASVADVDRIDLVVHTLYYLPSMGVSCQMEQQVGDEWESSETVTLQEYHYHETAMTSTKDQRSAC